MNNLSRPNSPTRASSYSSLFSASSSLTSALTWTFGKLASRHGSPPNLDKDEEDVEIVRRYTPPPLPPLKIPAGSTLTPEIAEEIRNLLPPRLQLHDSWTLAYSLEQHGVSLGTLYKKAQERARGGFVLVVKDSIGGVCPAVSKHSGSFFF